METRPKKIMEKLLRESNQKKQKERDQNKKKQQDKETRTRKSDQKAMCHPKSSPLDPI